MRLVRWCSLLTLLFTLPVQADDAWWFDVEVIAFKRNIALSELEERFDLSSDLLIPHADVDVIGAIVSPDISWLKQGLSVCDADELNRNLALWPDKKLFFIPPHDVDFLSLSLSQPEDTLGLQGENVNANNANDTERLENTPSPESVVEVNQDDILDTESNITNETPSTLGPDDYAIANHWLHFFGVSDMSMPEAPTFSYCENVKPWMTTANNSIVTHRVNNSLPAPQSLPVTIEGHDWPLASHPHLLSSEQQTLASLSKQIRQNRALERLIHVTWRQPVFFGKENAFTVRLFAGENYSQRFNSDGSERQLMPNTTSIDTASYANEESTITAIDPDIFDNIATVSSSLIDMTLQDVMSLEGSQNEEIDTNNVQDTTMLPPIWELDGTVKVFLKYINRVPYLHIDNNVFFRLPIVNDPREKEVRDTALNIEAQDSTEADAFAVEMQSTQAKTASIERELVSIPFSEQRRVISKQLHYFDHPLFGMIMTINRYQRPVADTEEPTS